MKRIGVLLPTWIGDACMATPTIRALRLAFPDCHLTVVGRPVLLDLLNGASVAGGGPLFDATLRFDKKKSFSRIQLAWQLRRRHFDLLLLLPNAFWAGMAAKISLAHRTIGYGRDGRSWLLTDPVPFSEEVSKSQIEDYLGLAHWVGCDCGDKSMSLGVTPDEAQMANDLWESLDWSSECPTLLINNNTALDRRRVWPADRVEAVAKHAEERGWQVLLHCGPSERAAADTIANRLARPKIASMGVLSELPLGLSKAVIERAALVLTTDSGPRHIAVALNRQVISLFGPTKPETTRTFNVAETIIVPDEDRAKIMQSIETERVLDEFEKASRKQSNESEHSKAS